MNAANERINIINVIILEYRIHIDPILLLYFIQSDFSYVSTRQAGMRSRRS